MTSIFAPYASTKAGMKAIAALAKTDHSHIANVKAEMVKCIKHAAEHGDCDLMTAMHEQLTNVTASALKTFVTNVCSYFGKEKLIGEGDDARAFSVFQFKRERPSLKTPGYIFTPANDGSVEQKYRKAIRAEILEASDDIWHSIPWISTEERDRETEIPTAAASFLSLSKWIKREAGKGALSKATLAEINRVIPVKAMRVNLDQEYKSIETVRKAMEETEKKLAAQRAFVERLLANETNDNEGEGEEIETVPGNSETVPMAANS